MGDVTRPSPTRLDANRIEVMTVKVTMSHLYFTGTCVTNAAIKNRYCSLENTLIDL